MTENVHVMATTDTRWPDYEVAEARPGEFGPGDRVINLRRPSDPVLTVTLVLDETFFGHSPFESVVSSHKHLREDYARYTMGLTYAGTVPRELLEEFNQVQARYNVLSDRIGEYLWGGRG